MSGILLVNMCLKTASRIETLYEDLHFKERRLAALVASKVNLRLQADIWP